MKKWQIWYVCLGCCFFCQGLWVAFCILRRMRFGRGEVCCEPSPAARAAGLGAGDVVEEMKPLRWPWKT